MPRYRLTVNGRTYEVEVVDPRQSPVTVVVNGATYHVHVEHMDGRVAAAQPVVAKVGAGAAPSPSPGAGNAPTPLPHTAVATAAAALTAPMPGKIIGVNVQVGQRVAPDQELCLLEAMKMGMPLRASAAGTVKEILVSVGQTVSYGDVLIVIE